jgi:hypothetical protein
MYLNTNNDIYVAHWVHTKWLVLSSFFFIIPAIYAFINNMYAHFILLFFTSLISANYWRKATYSWRRNMDLIFAKYHLLYSHHMDFFMLEQYIMLYQDILVCWCCYIVIIYLKYY